MVGFSPGGSSSLYAQALTRHMGRYLPGSPSFIMQHVPGAGGLVRGQQRRQHRRPRRHGVRHHRPHRRDRAAARQQERQVRRPPVQLDRHRQCRVHDLHALAHRQGEDAAGRHDHGGGGRRLRRRRHRGDLSQGGQQAHRHQVQGRPRLSRLDRDPAGDGARRGRRLLRDRLDLPQAAQGRLAARQEGQHPLPDVARRSTRSCRTFPPSSTSRGRRRIARCSSSCSRRRRWAGRSSRRPACRPSASRRCARPSRGPCSDPAFLAEAEKMGVEVQHVGGAQIQELVERIYASPPDVLARAKAVAE